MTPIWSDWTCSADVTDSVDTLRTGAQRKGGLAQVPSALALLQVA